MENLKYYVGLWGSTVSLMVGTGVILYDPIRTGIAGVSKNLWTVGPLGSAVLLCCLVLSVISWWCKKTI